ncbi:MAG: DUF692 family protein [Akkermansiaceae bacterium]|nr:DUF692 family protein [Akkermansiaceae bacterium]
MQIFDLTRQGGQLGLAYGPGVLDFLASAPGLIDYVEMPFEQLRHTPELISVQKTYPIVLHCASMSIAGFIPPSELTMMAIGDEAARIQTPWIGEHLAFVSADGISEEPDRDTTPTNLTYTLCPQLSEETVARVVKNLAAYRSRFNVPIILENSPQYFDVPGSTMDMNSFICEVASRGDVQLLLDLSHFMITSFNTGVNPLEEIDRLPLEKVVEIHISGLKRESGIVWDDHASPAPNEMFDLLERVMKRARPKALTLEYNWEKLPQSVLHSHIERSRRLLSIR